MKKLSKSFEFAFFWIIQGAGAGLFSWVQDRGIFLNGPFQFRVVENQEQMLQTDEIIPSQWIKFISNFYYVEQQQDEEMEQDEWHGFSRKNIILGSLAMTCAIVWIYFKMKVTNLK